MTCGSSSALHPLLEPRDHSVPRAEEPDSEPVDSDDCPTASEGPTPSMPPSCACDEARDPYSNEDGVDQACWLDEEDEWPVEWGSDTCSAWLIMLPL
jgi:hypothetical protein